MAGVAPGDELKVSSTIAKEAVFQIVEHIKKHFGRFNVSEIIKGGSLGHGTAVPGHYDIDLVVYSRDFTGDDVLYSHNMFAPWITKLKSFIQAHPGVTITSRSERYSVKFVFCYQGMEIDVDLLVSPYWENPENFYHFLQQIPRPSRPQFSVCAAKWQKQFFQDEDEQEVKEYIRRAKIWRNENWKKDEIGRPSSYLMSLLVVKAFENASSNRKVDGHSITEALISLVRMDRMDVYWADGPDDFYKRSHYKDLLPSRPRVVDPANPANNVWESGFCPPGHSSVFIRMIETIDLSQSISSLHTSKKAVDMVVTRIETKFKKFNISEIIKAGSLGHGTAVPGHYDIDLVIYSRDISKDAEIGFKKWIDLLKEFIEDEFEIRSRTSGRAVTFSVKCEGVRLQVDLLVSPYWNHQKEFYHFLRYIPKETRARFTVSASKWQVEFFKKLERQDIKEYIRRAKAWRNKNWSKGSGGRPKSYLMSLLVVKAYEMAPQKRAIEIERALKQLVVNAHSMDVYWEGEDYFYNIADYSDLLPSCPRLIDPANPANNVWETGIDGSSRVLVDKINTIDLSWPV